MAYLELHCNLGKRTKDSEIQLKDVGRDSGKVVLGRKQGNLKCIRVGEADAV